MATRSVCIYEEKYIGVDEIYTLCEGTPIYIEGKVEKLRELGHQKKLLCHCGCGANVILVAGKNRKRAPHFRTWPGSNEGKCTALDESDNSIWSKLMLKLWLKDKLQSESIESKVSLNRISSSDRKFEFTFYDYDNRVGICYWNKSDNITADKVSEIENCDEIRKVFYITDIKNAGTDGQYQEFMNKIQNVQGYNLFLNLNTKDMKNVLYEKITLDIRIFVKSYTGVWSEINVFSDVLSSYSFSPDMELLHDGELVKNAVERELDAFNKKEGERKENERIRQEKLQMEKERLDAEKAEKKRLAIEKAVQLLLDREAEKKRIAKERIEVRENKQHKVENDYLHQRDYTEDEERIADLNFATYGKPVINQRGDRYKQCKICGRKSIESYFIKENEETDSNLGICSDCNKHGNTMNWKKSERSRICPRCGGRLEKVYTGLGYRLRCKNYPICKYMDII